MNPRAHDRRAASPVLKIVAVSLLASLVILAAIVAGFHRRDTISIGHNSGLYVQLDRGSIIIFESHLLVAKNLPMRWDVLPQDNRPRVGYFGLGFSYQYSPTINLVSFVGIPLWPLLIVTAIVSVYLIADQRSKRRHAGRGFPVVG